jgi:hypothetical protein
MLITLEESACELLEVAPIVMIEHDLKCIVEDYQILRFLRPVHSLLSGIDSAQR